MFDGLCHHPGWWGHGAGMGGEGVPLGWQAIGGLSTPQLGSCDVFWGATSQCLVEVSSFPSGIVHTGTQ